MSRELLHTDGLAEAALRIRRLEARMARLEAQVARLEATLTDREMVERLFSDPATRQERVAAGPGDDS